MWSTSGSSGCGSYSELIRMLKITTTKMSHATRIKRIKINTESCNTTSSRTAALTSAAFRSTHRSESEPLGQSFSLKVQKTHSFHSLGVAYEGGVLIIVKSLTKLHSMTLGYLRENKQALLLLSSSPFNYYFHWPTLSTSITAVYHVGSYWRRTDLYWMSRVTSRCMNSDLTTQTPPIGSAAPLALQRINRKSPFSHPK